MRTHQMFLATILLTITFNHKVYSAQECNVQVTLGPVAENCTSQRFVFLNYGQYKIKEGISFRDEIEHNAKIERAKRSLVAISKNRTVAQINSFQSMYHGTDGAIICSHTNGTIVGFHSDGSLA